ncbi:lipase [Micromonospora sp. ATCC 39149]|uniref:RICIN domain-containing protein n=1 Tax=Micromonospora carbonacea TaxID=47853 RepID=A0A7D6CEI2_9ACTN|nr:RICIN domain-containing protein [Micromonospora sp. ATCC 39149]EEP74735.1 lipase [Micromonospora sp. ATCC 39149]QLK00531.1 RICIN domain-containing protein [Micromonospora carbonacea]
MRLAQFLDAINQLRARTGHTCSRRIDILAALEYLTGQSPVRDRADPNRLAVLGHCMGGGGAISATMRRPSLKAAVPLAPASFSQNLSSVRVPTLMMGARDDGTIPASSLNSLWATKPSTTKGAYVELSGGGHGFPTWGNSQVTRREIPWLKIFLDNDNRYTQFLCPSLADSTGVSRYLSECPYGSTGQPSSPPVTTPPASGGPIRAVGAGKCLDVPNASQTNDTQLTIWDCTGNPNQQWNVNANGTITGVQSGLCLDVTGGSTANGALAQLWSCNGGNNQQWRLG